MTKIGWDQPSWGVPNKYAQWSLLSNTRMKNSLHILWCIYIEWVLLSTKICRKNYDKFLKMDLMLLKLSCTFCCSVSMPSIFQLFYTPKKSVKKNGAVIWFLPTITGTWRKLICVCLNALNLSKEVKIDNRFPDILYINIYFTLILQWKQALSVPVMPLS